MRELLFSVTRRDLRVEYFSGTGKGGQHRNKHQNCVRMTHVETGISVQSTEHRERSQNLRVAFRRLAKRLERHWRAREALARYRAPDAYVRTYHQPDNRVRDHASGLQQSWSEVVENLRLDDQIEARRLELLRREQEGEVS